jgi:hypothetical protein
MHPPGTHFLYYKLELGTPAWTFSFKQLAHTLPSTFLDVPGTCAVPSTAAHNLTYQHHFCPFLHRSGITYSKKPPRPKIIPKF